MLCSSCGYDNPPEHRYCGMCGTPFPHRLLTVPEAQSTLTFTSWPIVIAPSPLPVLPLNLLSPNHVVGIALAEARNFRLRRPFHPRSPKQRPPTPEVASITGSPIEMHSAPAPLEVFEDQRPSLEEEVTEPARNYRVRTSRYSEARTDSSARRCPGSTVAGFA